MDTRLEGRTLKKAERLLNDLVDYLELTGIDYHLEGGTLLGFVRDGGFLEWDHDIDISIPAEFAQKFYSNRKHLRRKGYRITRKKSKRNLKAIREEDIRIFKVKGMFYSFFRMFSGSMQRNELVADVFLKFREGDSVYWIAKEKLMEAPYVHYSGSEEVEYKGRKYKVPLNHTDYLTHKYGDWKVPVKEWDCAVDEKSVIMDAD